MNHLRFRLTTRTLNENGCVALTFLEHPEPRGELHCALGSGLSMAFVGEDARGWPTEMPLGTVFELQPVFELPPLPSPSETDGPAAPENG